MTNDEIHANAPDVIDRIKDQYLAFPGIKSVSLSNKNKAGKETGSYCIKFHVDEKKGIRDLPLDQIIPNNIEGIPTDVGIHHGDAVPFINPDATYRPMIPGIQIRTEANPSAHGTLGCFINITTAAANPTVTGTGSFCKRSDISAGTYLLTNEHVLRGGFDSPKVCQPGCNTPEEYCADFVASLNDITHDCAIAKIKPPTEVKNDIYTSYNTTITFNALKDPTVGMKVLKIGARTGLTEGIVTDLNYTSLNKQNQIIIEGAADHGDSGAIWVTNDGTDKNPVYKAVCLLWGGTTNSGKTKVHNFDLESQIRIFASAGDFA